MKITLLIPTMNEIDGMKKIMPLVPLEKICQVLIVDASTDGTAQYAKSLGYDVVLQQKKGIRNAYIEAMPYVKGDVVITFSPDGNSIPELIDPLIEKIKQGYDMVIVSRYAKGAKSYDDDLVTGFGNWLFTNLIDLLYGAKYTDAMVIYRAWKTKVFYDLDLDKDKSYQFEEKLFNTRIGIEPLLSIRAAKRRLNCCDIPGDEPARVGGVRKLQVLRWGLAYMWQVFREKFVWR